MSIPLRRFLTGTLAVVATLAVVGAQTAWSTPGVTTPTDWRELGFDAATTNHNPFETVLDPSNVAQIHRHWTAELGDAVFGAPAVVDGVVYVCTEFAVQAVDVATGAQIWFSPANGHCDSPAVSNGRVIANDGSSLRALDAATGAQLWSVPFGNGGTPAPPKVIGDTIYAGTSDGTMKAIDATTGATLWSFGTGGPIFGAPAIGDGR